MKSFTVRQVKSFFWLAVISGVAIAILSASLVWHQRIENHTRQSASLRNTAEIKATQIESSLDEIDTLLSILAKRYQDYPSMSNDQRSMLEQQIREELGFYTNALRVVVADQHGNQFVNTIMPVDHEGALPNISDRQYYQRALAGERGLIYDGPLAAKLDGIWSIFMVRSLEGVNGEFQGIVIVLLPTERLGHGFENIDLGQHGVVNLRTADLSLVTRYPEIKDQNLPIGSTNPPVNLKELIASKPDQSQHLMESRSAIDGIERVYVVQRLSHSPFWVSVGMSKADFESGWRLTSLLVIATSALVILMLFIVARKLDIYRWGLERLVQERTQSLSDSELRCRDLAELDQKIFEAMPVGLVIANADGNVIRANGTLLDLLGYSRQEIQGLPIRHVLFDEHLQTAFSKDQRHIPVDCGLSSLGEDSEQKLIYTVRDVSNIRRHAAELAQANDQAENANRRLFNATQAAGIGVYIWNVKTNALVWDPFMFELYGCAYLATDQPVHYSLWANRVHPEDLKMAESCIKKLLDGTGVYDPVFRIVLPNREIRYIKGSGFIEFDQQGQPLYMIGLNQDITAMHQSQLDLEEAQRLAKVGSWRFDLFSQRVEWSEALYRMFGLDPQKPAPGLSEQATIFTPESWERLQPAIKLAIDTGRPYAIELEFKKSDGELCWMLARGERVLDALGKPLLLRGTAADITLQKQQEMMLKEARQAAESANHAKSNFLSIMSHEIRTPLNAIIGTSYLLSLDTQNDKQRTDLATISASSNNLLALINDVLDFSKIEAGELELEQRPFLLAETLLDIKAMFTPSVTQKGLHLYIDHVPAHLPSVLLGDSNRLKQVLINLINNAIKFTAAGSVKLALFEYAPTNGKQIFLRFEIKDTGIGIAAEAQGRLFSPFMQAEVSTSRKYGGTGLGLSIVKRITVLMGGHVGVQSVVGVGTTFTLDLPFSTSNIDPAMVNNFEIHSSQPPFTQYDQPLPGAGKVEGETTTGLGKLSGLHIMVVDDSEINLQITRRILEKEGASVTLCNSGSLAIKTIVEYAPPDAILMDLQMPEMDGCETTLLIRQKVSDELPILALTAGATTTEKDRALASGMSGFLTKPIDPRGLVRTLKSFVN